MWLTPPFDLHLLLVGVDDAILETRDDPRSSVTIPLMEGRASVTLTAIQ